MKLRLTAYITAVLFLGVVVLAHFCPLHNSKARHIDKGLSSIEQLSRKVKKHVKETVTLTQPPLTIYRIITFFNPVSEVISSDYSPLLIVSCRAPPAYSEIPITDA